MPTKMNCPGCQTPLRLRDGLAGTKFKCPRCATVVTVPAAGEKIETTNKKEEKRVRNKPRSKYKPCPRCGDVEAERVTWTAWGSFYGPALFTHVRCPGCSYAYNGKSGRSNLVPAIFCVFFALLFILGIVATVGWVIHQRGYF